MAEAAEYQALDSKFKYLFAIFMLFSYNYNMRFEYDPKKSASNKKKHGITLELAKSLWQGFYIEITAKTVDEPRYMVIGKIENKLYSCVFTMRHDVVRLISARRSRKSEEALYYGHFKK